ncbi:hypothetical protein LCGC14_3038610, partial [marine sediment metagenome]
MRYRKYVAVGVAFVVSMLLILTVSWIEPVLADVTWTKYSGELSMGGERYVLDASVVNDGGTYKMWYTHGKIGAGLLSLVSDITTAVPGSLIGNIADLDMVSFLGNLDTMDEAAVMGLLDDASTVIGYATSTDGTTWTVVNTQVLAGSGGLLNSVGAPSVIRVSGTDYRMWYTRFKTNLTQASLETALTRMGTADQRSTGAWVLQNSTSLVIGYATSTDGVGWTLQNSEVLVGSGGLWHSVRAPSVVRVSDTDYRMWYTQGKTDVTRASLAAMDEATLASAELWDILDSSSSVIGYATSTDGIIWTVEDSEVLAGSGVLM